MEEELPEAVGKLLTERVMSLEQLETLLAVRTDPVRQWTLQDVAARLRLPEPSVEPALAELTDNGLLEAYRSQGEQSWRYAPSGPELQQAVELLAQVYDDRRLEIMRLLSSRAMDRIRNSAARAFADAFIIGRKKDG